MKGGTCWGNNVQDLHVRVLDNNIWERKPTGGRDATYTGTKSTAEGQGPPVIGPGGTPWSGGGPNQGGVNASAAVTDVGTISSSTMANGWDNSISGSASSQTVASASSSLSDVAVPSASLGLQHDAVVPDQNGFTASLNGDFAIDAFVSNTGAAISSSSVSLASSSKPVLSSSASTASQSISPQGAEVQSTGGETGLHGECAFGEWTCDSDRLRLCGNVTGTTVGEWRFGDGEAALTLGWIDLQTCPGGCEITQSGSVICR